MPVYTAQPNEKNRRGFSPLRFASSAHACFSVSPPLLRLLARPCALFAAFLLLLFALVSCSPEYVRAIVPRATHFGGPSL
ncbi:hypothetical protein B0H17DRAFT_1032180 [Mycena rosella]|uniref:Transmembrane protein n=1 Tax=Mycena rosella TaxID=1033263 RepID=A0AAD7MAJ2_MYCRO|nr:hypothetical protein B0H17DRAFT_1032180 [Mycena rosella]